MKKFVYIFIFLLVSVNVFSQTTYYFSSSTGDDGNSGTSPAAAKKELRNFDFNSTLSTGDSVRLKRGDTWDSTYIYFINKDNITFTTYGTGVIPIVNGFFSIGTPSDNGDNTWTYNHASLNFDYYSYVWYQSGEWTRKANHGGWIFMDNEPRGISIGPDDDSFYDCEAVAGDYKSWITETDQSYSTNSLVGASGKFMIQHWLCDETTVTSNSGTTINLTSSYFESGNLSLQNSGSGTGIKYWLINAETLANNNYEWWHNWSAHTIDVYHTGSLSSSPLYMSLYDTVFYASNCNNLKINNIEFQGGLNSTIRIDSSHVTIDSVNVKYSTIDAITLHRNDYINLQYDSISHSLDRLVSLYRPDTSIIEHCYISNAAVEKGSGGDRYMSFTGLYLDKRSGPLTCQYNYVDSTAYSGIHTFNYTPYAGATDDMIVKYNYVGNCLMILTDGGAYHFTTEKGDNFKYIEHNIVDEVNTNTGPSWNSQTISNGIYLDAWASNFIVDSNYISNSQYGIYLNGTDSNQMSYNDAVRIKKAGYIGKEWGYGHNGDGTSYCDYFRNVSVGYSTSAYGYMWFWGGAWSNDNNDSDTNRYYNPYEDSDGSILDYDDWVEIQRSLSSWNSISGFEDQSTYNPHGWTMSDVSGITNDQMITSIFNWSSQNDTIDIFDLILKDKEGTNHTDSIVLLPYSGMILWYVSGTPDSISYISEKNFGGYSSSSSPPITDTMFIADTIEAEDYTYMHPDLVVIEGTYETYVGYWGDTEGEYIYFDDVYFDNIVSVDISVAVPAAYEDYVYVYIDSLDNPEVDSLLITDTGGWEIFNWREVDLDDTITGLHRLYLVSNSPNIDKFTGTSYIYDPYSWDRYIKIEDSTFNSPILYTHSGYDSIIYRRCIFQNLDTTVGGAILGINDVGKLTIDSCTFKNIRSTSSSDLHAINITKNADSIIIINSTFENIAADGVQVGHSFYNDTINNYLNYMLIDNCDFISHVDSSSEDGIDIKAGFTDKGIIRNCTFRGLKECLANSGCTGGTTSAVVIHYRFSNNIYVYDNIINNCALGLWAGMGSAGGNPVYEGPPDSIYFYNNKIDSIYNGIDFRNATNVQAYNNFISNYWSCGLYIRDTENIKINNNTVAKGSGYAIREYNASTGTTQYTNNLYAGPNGTQSMYMSGSNNLTITDYASIYFVSYSTDNYHLTSGSTNVIDQGTNNGLLIDIDNEVRPNNGTYDVGADEYYTSSSYPKGLIYIGIIE